MPRKKIVLVLEEHAKELMSLHGVIGIAVGKSKGKLCIKVFVNQRKAELLRQIPLKLEGYPVLIEHKRQFRAVDI